MLTIKNLVITENKSNRVLVNDLSFTINKKDKIAIIGSEGVGKSTLLKIIHAKKNLEYANYSGEIISNGVIAYLPQTIIEYEEELLIDFLIDNNPDNYIYLERAYKILGDFGFDIASFDDRKIKTFSGGEKMKISLTKAIMRNPDILLLDEPTNDLDLETIIFLEGFIKKSDLGILYISHDTRLLENTANAIIHLSLVKKRMEAKSFFLKMTYDEYYDYYLKHYETNLRIASKQRAEHKKKIERFQRIYQSVEHQQNQAVRNPFLASSLKVKIRSLKAQSKRFEKEKKSFVEIPEKEESINIFFQNKEYNPTKTLIDYRRDALKVDNNVLVRNIHFIIKGIDKIAITGKNGTGKTTLLRDIKDEMQKMNIKIGYLSQNYQEILNYEATVVQFLLNNQALYLESEIKMILGNLGFSKLEMDNKISDISEGQKLKVALLLLIALDTEILLLDEPTRNISPINAKEIFTLFENYQGAILCITHDRAFLEEVFDKILVIENQKITYFY